MNTEKLKLLFALQEQPVAPASVLAKQVGVSAPTARAWLESLEEDQVFVGVHANLRFRRMGLELDDFLLQVTSHEALEKIEKFCWNHPYTSYRARVFGGNTQGILLQFRQPDAARPHLLKAFDVMKKNGLISEIRELPTLNEQYGSSFTRPRIESWNPETMGWEFDWDEWWSACPKMIQSKPKKQTKLNELVPLDELDVRIIQEISINARRKNIEIIEALGMDKTEPGIQQKISSKLKRLSEDIVESYRVYINWTHFDVYNTPIIIAEAEEEVTDRIIAYLSGSKFPFGSSIRKIESGFIWSARLPSAHLSELLSLVWRISKRFEILIIDYNHSEVYGLWAEAFDSETNSWKKDR
ncbi:MAG: Lrp/AsnC family transcriptional regulator [Candidatus Thorarchaeota archaeon]|nr:Lrp/AsnC family transcriptional regulator [Candidatus Thorarchaeota archaeon]